MAKAAAAQNVVALVKGGERYVFLYDEESTPQVFEALGRFATNPDLSFNWYDAATLSRSVHALARESGIERPASGR